MGRVFFPTYSLNRFGVRVASQRATLGEIKRLPAEPTPRSAMTPTGPILGAVAIQVPNDGPVLPGPMPVWNFGRPDVRPTGPIIVRPLPIISSSGGGGTAPTPPATPTPPVSQQVGPTPTVVTPPSTPVIPVFISSGGGVAAPSLPTVTAPAVSYATDANGNIINGATGAIVLSAAQAASMGTSAASLNAGATGGAASPGVVNQVTAWLGGSTSLLGYSVPNALLAGAVVLGFAWLSSSGKKR
jgi:hypothetical protein